MTNISENSAAIALTENAAKRVAMIAEKQNAPAIFRLSVEGGGCSGFQYKYGLAQSVEDDDEVAETNGVKLVVDPISMDFLNGAVVDFVENLGGASFQVTNPNAQAGCGCGTSFAI